jgi:hypothetical protein
MKQCGVFDLMIDIVEMWLRDQGIKAPDGAWTELIARLGACDRQLSKRYQCSRIREEERV